MASLNETPSGNRIHIGVFGKTNSGKSSLVNAFMGQNVSIVADVAGTTTDPVYKAMEIAPLGACTIIDTPGFNDETRLSDARFEKTTLVSQKCDVAMVLFDDEGDMVSEIKWCHWFKHHNTPVVAVISKCDEKDEEAVTSLANAIEKETGIAPVTFSTKENVQAHVETLKQALIRSLPEHITEATITGNLVKESDTVLLVMPQDIQAPKGRLILPQVQTIRELLDKKCIVTSVTTDKYIEALNALKNPPKLIITDSQVFPFVYEHKPEESLLTSFSVLFAAYKGDISYYVESVAKIASLKADSRILIAECCTHAPLAEDIGREKIPAMLRKRFGDGLTIDVVSGTDFPTDLSSYDLVIQCGGCMFNRKYITSRIENAKIAGTPMTNYGITIAYMSGILDKVVY